MTFHAKDGSVFAYEVERTWCREGIAVARPRDGVLIDTYWEGGSETHALTNAELATREFLFNTNDYREIGRNDRFEDYRREDRQTIPSQHGLVLRRFVKLGAKPDLDTQIENAENAVIKAEGELSSAERRLQWAKHDLTTLRAKKIDGKLFSHDWDALSNCIKCGRGFVGWESDKLIADCPVPDEEDV